MEETVWKQWKRSYRWDKREEVLAEKIQQNVNL